MVSSKTFFSTCKDFFSTVGLFELGVKPDDLITPLELHSKKILASFTLSEKESRVASTALRKKEKSLPFSSYHPHGHSHPSPYGPGHKN